MIIPKEHKERLDSIAKAYVDKLFEDFQDPKNRGPKFTWKGFPRLVGGIVYVSTFMCFTDEEWQPHYKSYAKRKATEYAKKLIAVLP